MSSQDPFDSDQIETLIAQVHQHPAIWCSKHKQNGNKYYVAKEWSEISRIVGFSISICQKEWKKLLKKFRDEKKLKPKLSSGSAAVDDQSKWEFYDLMSFTTDDISQQKDMSGNLDNLEGAAPPKTRSILHKRSEGSKNSINDHSIQSKREEDLEFFKTLIPFTSTIVDKDMKCRMQKEVRDTVLDHRKRLLEKHAKESDCMIVGVYNQDGQPTQKKPKVKIEKEWMDYSPAPTTFVCDQNHYPPGPRGNFGSSQSVSYPNTPAPRSFYQSGQSVYVPRGYESMPFANSKMPTETTSYGVKNSGRVHQDDSHSVIHHSAGERNLSGNGIRQQRSNLCTESRIHAPI